MRRLTDLDLEEWVWAVCSGPEMKDESIRGTGWLKGIVCIMQKNQPMKRKERGTKRKSSEPKGVEQGTKGVLLVIKLPHSEVPLRMPHSETVQPSNRHWGDISTTQSADRDHMLHHTILTGENDARPVQ